MALQKLTPKQARFIENYKNNGGNATQAARDAGYKDPEVAAYFNKQNKAIQTALLEYEEELRKRNEITADNLIAEMRPIITCATSEYVRMGDEGLYLIAEAINDPIKSKAIKQIRQTQYGVEIVFHDKLRAVELVARMTGVDQPKQTAQEVVRYEYGEVEELME